MIVSANVSFRGAIVDAPSLSKMQDCRLLRNFAGQRSTALFGKRSFFIKEGMANVDFESDFGEFVGDERDVDRSASIHKSSHAQANDWSL